LLRIWRDWRSSYLNSTAWMEWSSEQTNVLFLQLLNVLLLITTASKTVRKPRPPYVFLRVGEVVIETRGHMVGVVVSWDPELRAPAEWVDRMYSDFEGIKAEKTPHYKVLFNGPAGSSLLVAYLPQTQLERITGLRVSLC
ncbi:hypothetical protein NL108_008860, partial [Boleophthalmus pectinirostris]